MPETMIEEDVWIGDRAIVLAGLTIDDPSVITAARKKIMRIVGRIANPS